MNELEWPEVATRFAEARNWWVSTSGSSGPHAVPVWGVCLGSVLVFWGSPQTVRSRNVKVDPRVVLHLEDGENPLIVHGSAVATGLASEDSKLVEAFRKKYQAVHDRHYQLDGQYAAGGIAYIVVPSKALSWEVVAPEDWVLRRWTA